jgi:acetoin utilization deacetylase AcuC-like enzyme
MKDTLPVFYDSRMAAEADTYSPHVGKARRVVDDWKASGLLIRVEAAARASELAMSQAHRPGRVERLLRCEEDNGFGDRSTDVAAALPWSVGSMMSAAIFAAGSTDYPQVACSPSSGFHHAGHDYSHGFCTINGLIVAAMAVKRAGLANRVTIIDCGFHYGDGTQDIIDTLKLDWITHWSAGLSFMSESAYGGPLPGYPHTFKPTARDFLGSFPNIVKYFATKGDLVLYQAGADQHVNDPLGGFLTTEQMIERDRTLFWICREYNRPVAWNLAGGYQKPLSKVVAIHENTFRAAVTAQLRS